MLNQIIFRLLGFVPTLLIASLILFFAVNVVPGSASRAALGIHATPQAIARFEHKNGLDKPLLVQYGNWLVNLVKGDFGKSFQNSVNVAIEIKKRLPITLQLAIYAFVIALCIAIPLGLLSAYFHQKLCDGLITSFATLCGSMPNFLLATILIYFFSIKFRIFPSGGYVSFSESPIENFRSLFLASLSLGIVSSGLLIRIMRTVSIEVLSENFIELVRSKGAGGSRIIIHHLLRNSMIPFLTVASVEFGFLIGSVVIIEEIFRIPGIGSLVLVGIINRDYPVLLSAAMIITVIVLLTNLVVDTLSTLIDPRQIHKSY